MADNARMVQIKLARILQTELSRAAEIASREAKLIETVLSDPDSYLRPEHGRRFEDRVENALKPLEKLMNELPCLGEAGRPVREGYNSICEDVSLVRNLSNMPRDVQEANRDLFLAYYVKGGILPFRKVIEALEILKELTDDEQPLEELKSSAIKNLISSGMTDSDTEFANKINS